MFSGPSNAVGSPRAVVFGPADIVRRRSASWSGLSVESIEVTRATPFEYGLTSPFHLLIVSERAARFDGETSVEGLPVSHRRRFSRKLSFVPAGCRFHGWQEPRLLARATYVHIDPAGVLADPAVRFERIAFTPRLFVEDEEIWSIAVGLKKGMGDSGDSGCRLRAETLGAALLHSLARFDSGAPSAIPVAQGGLAGWQRQRAADYIEANLDKPVSLATLAEIARLSPYHFARAFKRSLGVPPHRYHRMRRIDRAKELLADPRRSVTEIGLAVGFAETSSFTAAFRKATGMTPTEYRRGLA